MGWCSATRLFDSIVSDLKLTNIDDKHFHTVVWNLICELEDMDWDCQSESDFWEDEQVRGIFKEMNPTWFADDE
jgi:hypothetical protein